MSTFFSFTWKPNTPPVTLEKALEELKTANEFAFWEFARLNREQFLLSTVQIQFIELMLKMFPKKHDTLANIIVTSFRGALEPIVTRLTEMKDHKFIGILASTFAKFNRQYPNDTYYALAVNFFNNRIKKLPISPCSRPPIAPNIPWMPMIAPRKRIPYQAFISFPGTDPNNSARIVKLEGELSGSEEDIAAEIFHTFLQIHGAEVNDPEKVNIISYTFVSANKDERKYVNMYKRRKIERVVEAPDPEIIAIEFLTGKK